MTKHKNKSDNVYELPPDWKASFQNHAMRTSFALALTQPMLEFLCAVADDVQWDRRMYYRQYGQAKPDSYFGSGDALIKRGLIERLTRVEIDRIPKEDSEMYTHSHHRLTPAGSALVELLRVTGIFVESDAVYLKRAKAKK